MVNTRTDGQKRTGNLMGKSLQGAKGRTLPPLVIGKTKKRTYRFGRLGESQEE